MQHIPAGADYGFVDYLSKLRAFGLARDLFALLLILVIWGFQERSLAIFTPKYLAEFTSSRFWPCREYWVEMGDLDWVI